MYTYLPLLPPRQLASIYLPALLTLSPFLPPRFQLPGS